MIVVAFKGKERKSWVMCMYVYGGGGGGGGGGGTTIGGKLHGCVN